MKLSLLSLLAVLAASLAASPDDRAAFWLNRYYLDPQPAELVSAVQGLSRGGYFEEPGQPAQAIGFFSVVFAQNPEAVDGWFASFRGLPAKHQRVLASALWYSGHPRGEAVLRGMAETASPEMRATIRRLVAGGVPTVAESPVLSESSMNLQWGAFLASGSELHITNILVAVGAGQPGIPEAARLSLAMNAAVHPRVMEICRAQLDKQPNEVRAVLQAAMKEAQAQTAGKRS
jgi:hypothetical protein